MRLRACVYASGLSFYLISAAAATLSRRLAPATFYSLSLSFLLTASISTSLSPLSIRFLHSVPLSSAFSLPAFFLHRSSRRHLFFPHFLPPQPPFVIISVFLFFIAATPFSTCLSSFQRLPSHFPPREFLPPSFFGDFDGRLSDSSPTSQNPILRVIFRSVCKGITEKKTKETSRVPIGRLANCSRRIAREIIAIGSAL